MVSSDIAQYGGVGCDKSRFVIHTVKLNVAWRGRGRGREAERGPGRRWLLSSDPDPEADMGRRGGRQVWLSARAGIGLSRR